MTLIKTARVQTSLGPDVLLFLSFDGSEAMGQPFEYQVDLLSMDEEIDFASLLGQPMTVVLELPLGQVREFSGIVARFVSVGKLGRYVRFHPDDLVQLRVSCWHISWP